MNYRALHLELLDSYRYRGQLLARIKHRIPMSTQEDACIALHDHWDDFVQAERWNHAHQRRCPSNLAEALELIVHWHQAGSPSVFTCTVKGAVCYVWRQGKIAIIYALWESLDLGASVASVVASITV